MPVGYRDLLRDDIAAISRVHRRACLVAYSFMSWDYEEPEIIDWYAERFSRWSWAGVAEAEADGIVAHVAVIADHIDQLFVDPDHQGRGIGTTLLQAALVRVGRPATLTVFEANLPARRLYEHHGFVETGRQFNEENQAVELTYARVG